jgi:hypothetical protein
VIVTVHEKVPVALTVASQPVTLAPLPMVVATVVPGVNPAPVTVTETPLGPCPGAIVTLGVVRVNEAVALSKGPSAPDAVSV